MPNLYILSKVDYKSVEINHYWDLLTFNYENISIFTHNKQLFVILGHYLEVIKVLLFYSRMLFESNKVRIRISSFF